MNSVSLTPIDIPEKIAIEDNIVFDQNLIFLLTKKIDDKVCHKNVKKIADISISSIVKNADELLSKKPLQDGGIKDR